MTHSRTIKKIIKGQSVLEGAGVRLRRIFGSNDIPVFDPFLLLDDFRSTRPSDFIKGFPWHPHRGIETITYVLKGDVEHGDSLGNTGTISSGDVQWMTAGSGIIHQEMPKGDENGQMEGFQLWANLPAANKMMAPRYRDIKAGDIPEIQTESGTSIKVICGKTGDIEGPATEIVIDPIYLDITVPENTIYEYQTQPGYTFFAYIIHGKGFFDLEKKFLADNGTLILFEDGDHITVNTHTLPVRFLLIGGKPLKEKVEWHGPIVMNTEEELETAFDEYQKGTFIKHK
ncbi:MAG: pirin family protein [Proteobacteria bacterium]|nr:pirin family protein [Pseudomonadota bacterium]